ncbi:MAG TPA: hypothetical protein ENI20_19805 [Bacteroides sp.]|nr:hypothetical protein [Bacteroides sp.]
MGHNHPRINRAITKQLDLVQHMGYHVKNSRW